MKKSGILHAQLSGCVAALGHKDLFMVGDAGMPIPPGVTVIDLAVTKGVPTFRQVMDALLSEAAVEGCYLAEEIHEHNPCRKRFASLFVPASSRHIPMSSCGQELSFNRN